LPSGTLNHDEITELALGLLSDLHTNVDKDNKAAIAGKVQMIGLLLKTTQDKRAADPDKPDAAASLVDLLRGLR